MKKTLFLSVLTLIAFTTQAQIKFGIKAGANFTTFSGSDATIEGMSPKYKVGFAGGGLVNIQLSEMFSLQPEVLYSMEGATYTFEGESAHLKTDYINIPVLAQYNNASGFYAETGPQVGFLTSAKISADGNSVNMKDFFKKTNFSWGFGAGYKLSNGLGFGARYNLGLTSIADADTDESVSFKAAGFHIGLSYTFGGSRE
ncbi:MAG TPA: porin family protein [Agriterribacter sp.]|nr:porin family protein [Agriterribacter sp.]